MKIIIFLFLLSFSLFRGVNGQFRQSDLHAGNFYLQNQKIQFEKRMPGTLPLPMLEKQLKSFNDMGSGIQVKLLKPDEMNGVFIRYQVDWTQSGLKGRKISGFLKLPVNAVFEVKKINGDYVVKIINIWFNNSSGNQHHLTLESQTLSKNGFSFSRDKKVMQSLSILDEQLNLMFSAGPGF